MRARPVDRGERVKPAWPRIGAQLIRCGRDIFQKSGEWAALRYPLIEQFPGKREAARCERGSLYGDHNFVVVALRFLTPPFSFDAAILSVAPRNGLRQVSNLVVACLRTRIFPSKPRWHQLWRHFRMGYDPTIVSGLYGFSPTFWIEKSPSEDRAEQKARSNPYDENFCDDLHLSPKTRSNTSGFSSEAMIPNR